MIILVWVCAVLASTHLYSMQSPQAPVITWAKPRTQPIPQDHETIHSLQKKLLKTPQGVELVRRFVEDQPQSASSFEGLDIAGGKTQRQNHLRVVTLLAPENEKDRRGYMLYETLCTPQALNAWRTLLSKKPLLHNPGWSPEQDATFAQKIVKSTRIAALLKNQLVLASEHTHLLNTERAPIFSPDYNYVYVRCNDMVGKIFDTNTWQEIYCAPDMVDSQECTFSADSSLCFLQQGKMESDRRVAWVNRSYTNTDLIAFHLKKRTRINTALGTIRHHQTMPACAYSTTARFAVLAPTYKVTPRLGLCNTESQEVVVKFPATLCGTTLSASVSPQEKYSLFETREGFKLFDLSKNGEEITTFNTDQYNIKHTGAGHWVPHQEMCLFPTCHAGEGILYTVYYPETNSTWALEPSQHHVQPCYSIDGRYCFLSSKDAVGRLYDLIEKKIVKTYDTHRVCDVECPPVLFSEDPTYPYCVVHVWDKERFEKLNKSSPSQEDVLSCMKVSLLNYQTGQEVPEIGKLSGIEVLLWPKQSPYYLALYPYHKPNENYSKFNYSIEIRKKKNHDLVMRADNATISQPWFDKQYVNIEAPNQPSMLIDVITQKKLGHHISNWEILPSGQMVQFTGKQLIELAPPNCNWDTITSQQLSLVLYALGKCTKGTPVDLTKDETEPLRHLFESLDVDMQKYVAKACNIKM